MVRRRAWIKYAQECSASWRGIDNRCDSGCALQLARRGAGRSGAGHASFADINTLAEVSCIKLFVTLGDASTLLIRILNVLRTRCGADGYCDQSNEASRLHGGVSN
jgi:hypothetical protein